MIRTVAISLFFYTSFYLIKLFLGFEIAVVIGFTLVLVTLGELLD